MIRTNPMFRTIGLEQLIVCVLGFAVAGGALGYILRTPAPPPVPAPTSAPVASLAVGDLRVRVPAGWSRSATPLPVPGLSGDRAVTLNGPAGSVVIAQAAPGDRSLLPTALIRSIRGRLRPQQTKIAGVGDAVRYAGVDARGAGTTLDVLALPTTHDVAVAACPTGSGGCEAALAALRIAPDRVVPTGADAALRARLDDVIVRLSAARRAARETLALAGHSTQRADGARAGAGAYRDAAGALAPLASTSPNSRALLDLLGRLAGEHDQLATAAKARDRKGFAGAAHAITADEATLEQQFARWHGAA
jgi:hypothetical protein